MEEVKEKLDQVQSEDVGEVFQIIDSGGSESFEKLSETTDRREAYAVPKGHPLEGFIVRDASEQGNRQNRREARVFAESIERGEVFTPAVAGWSVGFDYLLVERVNPLEEKRANEHRARGMRQEAFQYRRTPYEGVVPEGWIDEDRDTEYGTDGNKVLVIDPGMFRPENSWSIGDPGESKYFEDRGDYTIANF